MTASIPASAIVAVNPGVLATAGNALGLNGLFLTSGTRVPLGTVASFSTADAVSDYFGATATETLYANVYFAGYDNSTVKPGNLLISQYPTGSVAAYLRGGNVSALTLTQLQALSGVLVVTIDAVVKTSSSINLSSATGFSNAATLINTALGSTGPVAAVVTGSIATTAGGTLTVTAVSSGTLAVGDILAGSGITSGTTITALGTGTGGTGTYLVSVSQTASSTTVTATVQAVLYDSQSGAFTVTSGTTGASSTIGFGSGSIAAGLKLTAATGAATSQGSVLYVPGTAMNAIKAATQDWVSFCTDFEPSSADKVLFASWTNDQNDRYAYICWSTEAAALTVPDTTSAGALIIAAGYSGTTMIYQPSDLYAAPFVCGAIASLDFARTNGRATLAFRSQSGLTAGVTNETSAANLLTNGYNFYGAYATAHDGFTFFYNGSVTGDFDWLDSYVDQIWLNSNLQLALLTLLTNSGSVPYNPAGYAMIDAACSDPINAALNAGAIRTGVALSASQIASVNAAAGVDISAALQTRGWYLQVSPATAATRVARGSPPITLWYTDGGSIQAVTLASIEIQ